MGLRGSRDTPGSATQLQQFLLVLCGSTHYAIEADAVRGVLRPEDGEIAQALVAFGVDVVPSHLSEQFGLPGSYLSPDSRMIICAARGADLRHIAFQVDGVSGLQDMDPSAIRPLPPHFSGTERQWFTGLCLVESTVAVVVNLDWLLSEDRFRLSSGKPASDRCARTADGSPMGHAAMAEASRVWNVLEVEEASDADDAPWAQL